MTQRTGSARPRASGARAGDEMLLHGNPQPLIVRPLRGGGYTFVGLAQGMWEYLKRD